MTRRVAMQWMKVEVAAVRYAVTFFAEERVGGRLFVFVSNPFPR